VAIVPEPLDYPDGIRIDVMDIDTMFAFCIDYCLLDRLAIRTTLISYEHLVPCTDIKGSIRKAGCADQ